MHITLISTDDEIWASGMRSISSTLREAGHQTTMIFAGASEVPINESVIRGIAALVGDSEIIGISSMSRGSSRAKMLIKGLRPLGRLIVWGGIHPTLFPEDCISHADFVCRGEGEEFMVDVAKRVASGRDLTDIPNGACLSNGCTILNDLHPLIDDLDSLPVLDFAFENEYILNQTGTLVPNTEMKEKSVVLFSGSRGCNNSCAYCSNSQLKSIYKGHGVFARKMSISRFIEVAGEYQQLFPQAKWFYFTDEDFFARPVEEMREFAEIYPSQVGLPFECMASPRQITEEKVALAAKAGLFQIDVGLESGSERIRREIFDRYIDDATQMKAAIAINKHPQVKTVFFVILGNPYEERQDLLDGIRLIEKLPPPFSLRAYNLVFIPGTKLFRTALRDGIIRDVGDSAFELNFLAGFDHRTHEWKRNNVYLNGLLSLNHGKHTRWRMGFVPRRIIPILTNRRVVDFCDHHTQIGNIIVTLAGFRLMMSKALPCLGSTLKGT
jgi:anaerobic magnesium-protoporphyrin IX monomethyl ester cyclase